MSEARRRAARAALDAGGRRLEKAGIDEGLREAERLLAFSLGVGLVDLITDPPEISPSDRKRWAEALRRRAAREPEAYIVGAAEFRSLAFRVGPGVLVPRPETEHLVDEALEAVPPDRPATVVDVGTGSGCIAVAFAVERPRARVLGVDRSPAALVFARENVRAHGVGSRVALLRADLLEALRGPVDLVLSNPPYVGDGETVDPEIGFEPRDAVFAGPDGLEAYRRLAPAAARVLRPGGTLLVETPGARIEELSAIFAVAGLVPREPIRDLAGRPRVLGAAKP